MALLEIFCCLWWIKQTYAVRYNVYDGRTGHIWGDRYASWIVAEGPPKDAKAYVFVPVVCAAGHRGRRRGLTGDGGGVPESGVSVANPAAGAEGSPHAGETARNGGSPPVLPAAPPLRTAKRP
jgi:hypothetical protein